ncbi:hypothetical protein CUS_5486 [Ruminococcus albus 8]|uniref:Uncharacterized protein n=1 Tax=Ruminococcus albus 8 TaxID=246199 RepID=E9SBK8_RUMAL|nr:hypothetical protein CUS_5486 [Ruminococcus albus 8]
MYDIHKFTPVNFVYYIIIPWRCQYHHIRHTRQTHDRLFLNDFPFSVMHNRMSRNAA